ncbi:unnamed protein product [Ectocarpus sp. CCAP 1310/34]|nr:unnamed protein product [Ectocarpus sp. CCAP 1310/34]
MDGAVTAHVSFFRHSLLGDVRGVVSGVTYRISSGSQAWNSIAKAPPSQRGAEATKEASTSQIKAAERPCIAARNSTDSDQQSHLVRVQEGAHSPCSSPPDREDPHDESGAVKGGNDRVQLFPATTALVQNCKEKAPHYTMAQPDRKALVALYNATGGAKWRNKRNWNTRAALSQWYGVEVDSQGRVVTLHLGGNNLQGFAYKAH